MYESVEDHVTREALDQRRDWLDDIIMKMPGLTAGGKSVIELLQYIAQKPSLVHSMYYLAPDNVKRIAQFIHFRR